MKAIDTIIYAGIIANIGELYNATYYEDGKYITVKGITLGMAYEMMNEGKKVRITGSLHVASYGDFYAIEFNGKDCGMILQMFPKSEFSVDEVYARCNRIDKMTIAEFNEFATLDGEKRQKMIYEEV